MTNTTFKVNRTVREQNTPNPCWKLLLDEVSFTDGDPHFVCSFVCLKDLSELDVLELNKISNLLKEISVMLVRSKIIAYLYRYKPGFYKQLIDKQIIKGDLQYRQPITARQWKELYDREDISVSVARMSVAYQDENKVLITTLLYLS